MKNPSCAGCCSRRHFLASNAFGIGSVALAWLLQRDGLLADVVRPELEQQKFDVLAKQPDSRPRANAMISLFMQGGPSQVDLLDPKPALEKYNGQRFPGSDIKYDSIAQATGKVMASPWKFQKHGESGAEVSELLPNIAEVVDDICVIRSVHTGVNNHGQSINALNTGAILSGRPALGSWMTYGLGTESQNLPAFVVMTDSSLPVLGVDNWSNGFLPSIYQGTPVRSKEPRILNLEAPQDLSGAAQKKYLTYLETLNQQHLAKHPGELDLEARIASYELAARMQGAAKDALDISKESEATKKLYGLDDPLTANYGARCLIARRLVERGVRFVQIFT